jgi:hypothetical protein
MQPTLKSSNSNDRNDAYIKYKVEEVACKYCSKYIPEENIVTLMIARFITIRYARIGFKMGIIIMI